jgi:hypothetical protein
MNKNNNEEDLNELVKQTFLPLNDEYSNLVFNKNYYKTRRIVSPV